jgi:hypothetical protein
VSFDVFLQGLRDGTAGPVDREGARRAFADLGLGAPDDSGFVRLDTPAIVVVSSASDVLEQLERGYWSWVGYRDQIARG